ncbi:MAG: flagellar basal body-associated FliL family protein, partial [Leptospirales bacterium]|nr:flagellar basal body-associated FliL family protein [Leptospirales bacterium]HMU81957.1 flagellar basal body-associated FliL family protein [Leptospiraceae bacterium]
LGFEKGSPAEGQINERKDVLRNIANLVLSGKRKADITSVQQQLDLREELRASFNHVVGGGIEEVYFNEFTLD